MPLLHKEWLAVLRALFVSLYPVKEHLGMLGHYMKILINSVITFVPPKKTRYILNPYSQQSLSIG